MSEGQFRPARGRINRHSSSRGAHASSGPKSGKEYNSDLFSTPNNIFVDQDKLKRLKHQYQSQLSILKDVFPDWTDDDLVLAVEESDGNLPATIDKISVGNVSQFFEVKKPRNRSHSTVNNTHTSNPTAVDDDQTIEASSRRTWEDMSKPPSKVDSTAQPNDQSGFTYGPITDAIVDVDEENDDTFVVESKIANATRVSHSSLEEHSLMSAFTSDLDKDLGIRTYNTCERKRIFDSLSDLLKLYALRLEGSVNTELERDAKEFVRQKCENITDYLRKSFWKSDKVEPEVSQRYKKVRFFLLQGPAYKWLLDNARASAKLSKKKGNIVETISVTIDDALQSLRTRQDSWPTNNLVQAKVFMDWDVQAFLRKQNYGTSMEEAVERAVTITGSDIDAQALSCIDYMRQTWPSSGCEMIRILQNALKSSTLAFSGIRSEYTVLQPLMAPGCLADGTTILIDLKSPRAVVEARGGQAALTELCEELAWLGAALRPSLGEGKYHATPTIGIWKIVDKSELWIVIELGATLRPLVDRFDSMSIPATNGTCWHAIFRSPVVVDGFPILARHENERGLEMSIDVMSTLAETHLATQYDTTLLVKGICTMLVPTRHANQSIIWHFLYNNKQRIPYYAFRQHCDYCVSSKNFNINDLRSGELRNFVGWASHVQKHLGTEDVDYSKISCAAARKCSAGLALEQKLTVSASKILGISGSIIRGNRDKPEYIQQSAYSMQIEAARDMSVLLYDVASERGWLMDGASALLHMVRTQVVRKPYGGSSSLFNDPKYNRSKFNHPKLNGNPDAAAEILQAESNMKHVVLREFDSYTDETIAAPETELELIVDKIAITNSKGATDEKSVNSRDERKEKYKITCFRELVSQSWAILEQIHDRQIDYTTSHDTKELNLQTRNALEGYEFMDIVSAKRILKRRFVNLESNGLEWRGFTKRIQAVTLFGRDFGEIFTPTPDIERLLCKDWRAVPPVHEYLTVPISLLKEIKQRSWEEGDVDKTSPELALGFFWIPPQETFKVCQSTCKHVLHDRVQQFCRSIPGKTSQPRSGSWCSHLFAQPSGAVIFGKDSHLDAQKLEAYAQSVTGPEISLLDSGLGSSLQSSSQADSTEENPTPGNSQSETAQVSEHDAMSLGPPDPPIAVTENSSGETSKQLITIKPAPQMHRKGTSERPWGKFTDSKFFKHLRKRDPELP